MSKYIKQRSQDTPNQIMMYFHQSHIGKIKKALGSKCTHVSHVEYPKYELQEVLNKDGEPKEGMFNRVKIESQYGVIARFKGKKEPIKAMLNGTPNDIKGEYYAQLKNDMINAARKRGIL